MASDVIATRIESFVKELEALVRAAAIDAVTQALGGGVGTRPSTSASVVRRAPTTTAPKKAPATTAPTGSTTAKLSFKRKKGSKRSPEQLAAIDAAILAGVKSHPGNGIEFLG